jgi:hypothetical protein
MPQLTSVVEAAPLNAGWALLVVVDAVSGVAAGSLLLLPPPQAASAAAMPVARIQGTMRCRGLCLNGSCLDVDVGRHSERQSRAYKRDGMKGRGCARYRDHLRS